MSKIKDRKKEMTNTKERLAKIKEVTKEPKWEMTTLCELSTASSLMLSL